jgi:hypothetical protein
MSHMEALSAGAAAVPPPTTSVGTIIGAGVGGAALVILVFAIAIRYRFVSAQINTPTVSSWNPGSKKKKTRVPDFDIELNRRATVITENPYTTRSQRIIMTPV